MNRVRGAVAALVAVMGIAVPACGNDDGGTVSSGSKEATSNPSAQSYVGLTKKEAIAKAEASDTPWRITREDDETFLVTQDYVESRINFEIDDDKVTNAVNG